MSVKLLTAALGAVSVANAFAATVYEENFMNYADRVPGMIVDDEALYVSNDPIWNDTGSLDVSLKTDSRLYLEPVKLPANGKFDLVLKFRFKELKEGEPSFFDLAFGAVKIRIASDGIAAHRFAAPLAKNVWYEFGLVCDGRNADLWFSSERRFEKVATVPLAGAKTFDVLATGGQKFGLTDIRITDGEGLPDYSAARHFASFKALSQPLAGAIVSDGGKSVDLTPKPRTDCAFVLGATNRTAKLVFTWADGRRLESTVSAVPFSEKLCMAFGSRKKGELFTGSDAILRFQGLLDRYVRPRMARFRSSWNIVPAGIDIYREYETLPAASKHAVRLGFVRAPGGAELWVDGSYVKTVTAPLPRLKKGETPPPAAELAGIEFLPGEGVAYRLLDAPKTPGYTVLDLAANPHGKAFAEAKLGAVDSRVETTAGYPLAVAAPLDSQDIAICHQGMGNWALEVDEYHGRAPEDGFPCACHFRLPSAPYGRAGIVFALDPDPKKDAILTLRLGRYIPNGSGGNMSSAATFDFSDGVPDWCRKIGEVEKGGRKLPLYFGDFPLSIGPVIDLTVPGSYLDFDITGKQGENLQQLDNSMKPDPKSDSAFNLFAVTLKRADFAFAVAERTPGNVFTEDERVRGMELKLVALADNAKGRVRWSAKTVEGAELFRGEKAFVLAKAGATDLVPIDFGAATPRGFYTLDLEAFDAKDVKLFAHEARFAILPEAKRLVSAKASPYATWWFNAHGSPGDEAIGFPIMKKAGIRKSSWRGISREESVRWDHLNCGNLWSFGERDFEMNADGVTGHFKSGTIQVPDPADPKKKIRKEVSGEERFVAKVRETIEKQVYSDHLLVWHESGPRGGVPEELLGLVPPEPSDRDRLQAAYVNEIGRLMRKHFPEIKLQIGNNSAAMGAAAKPLRYGARPEYFDYLGMETPAQVVPPERRTEVGILGMLASQDVASRLAKRKIPLNGAWEFIYRADRDMGEQLQAEWHARDVLISLAHDFFLISPGILFDCSSGYYNGLWGGAGLLQRGPYVYPKRAYVAYAVLTKVLDGAKFVRSLDTGSTTVYALEYRRLDGRVVTAFWCARGEADFDLEGVEAGTATELYGAERKFGAGRARIAAGGAPVYVTTAKPLGGVKVAGRRFAADAALAAKAVTAAALDRAEDFELRADPGIESTHHMFFPVMKRGEFTLRTVKDDEKGDAIEVALDLSKNADRSPYYTEYTTVRFRSPVELAGTPEVIGVWVKGDSNWGQIRFEIEDADGEVFKNLSTGKDWMCDVMDWPGNLAVNFDGWNFVYTPLRATDLVRTHSPGPYSNQWASEGGDKRMKFPVKVRAITVGINRCRTSLFGFEKTPGPAKVLLRDVGAVSR